MMKRAVTLSALAAAAQAAHLTGPMDDRLKACIAENCPAMGQASRTTVQSLPADPLPGRSTRVLCSVSRSHSVSPARTQAMNAPNYGGLGVNMEGKSSFGAFVAPPMNGGLFINDMNYALRTMGYLSKPITYRKVPGGPVNSTATVNKNITDAFVCGCSKCGATVEAIFQPVGRMVCKKFGHDLPCATEMDACIKANPLPASISTGSMATEDLKFTPVGPGKRNNAICWPEASFSAYKVGYNLTVECNATGTALQAGGGATALALAKCVAKSRTEAYQIDFNCLDVGGLTCGVPYRCAKNTVSAKCSTLSACTAPKVKDPSKDSLNCTSTSCSASADTDTCCSVPAKCSTLSSCTAPKVKDSSKDNVDCAGTSCSASADTDTCCSEPMCQVNYRVVNNSCVACNRSKHEGTAGRTTRMSSKDTKCEQACHTLDKLPVNGNAGDCPSILESGKSCSFACNDGFEFIDQMKNVRTAGSSKSTRIKVPLQPRCVDGVLVQDVECVEGMDFVGVGIIAVIFLLLPAIYFAVRFVQSYLAYKKDVATGVTWDGKGIRQGGQREKDIMEVDAADDALNATEEEEEFDNPLKRQSTSFEVDT
jgi:hypothetical protein